MVDAVETAITTATTNATAIFTAGVTILTAFLVWKKIKSAANRV